MNKLIAAKGVKGTQDKKGAQPVNHPAFAARGAAPTKRVVNPRGMRKK